MAVIRRQALDCVKHVRVHYQLPSPVSTALAGLFPEAEMRFHAFSRFVKGAHDQLALAVAGAWRGTGVIGDRDWVMVYFRDADPTAEPVSLPIVEQRLRHHFGAMVAADGAPAAMTDAAVSSASSPSATVAPDIPATRRLDVRHLACPWPVRRTRAFLETLPAGTVVEIEATDPAAPLDFRHFCATSPHVLLHWRERQGVFHFQIRCGVTGPGPEEAPEIRPETRITGGRIG